MTTIVIAGGSVKGIAMLGAIQYIHEQIGIENVNRFCGTSIGAIIGYMLCIGQTPLEIVHSVISTKILDKIKSEFSLEMLLTQQGMVSFDPIQEELELITLSKYGELFTLKTLYTKLGKELCCLTFNYSHNKIELLHHTTTPDIPCLTAIQMSSSIPFVFSRMIYNSSIYIDGGIADNLPIRAAIKLGYTKLLCVVANSSLPEESDPEVEQIDLAKLITLPIVYKTHQTIRKYQKRHIIVDIPVSQNILRFDLDVPEIMDMFSTGYKVCKTKLNGVDLKKYKQ